MMTNPNPNMPKKKKNLFKFEAEGVKTIVFNILTIQNDARNISLSGVGLASVHRV